MSRRHPGVPTGDPEEDYADAFAMNLLMPEQAVREMVRKLPWRDRRNAWLEVVVTFGVTQDIAVRRLRDLGLWSYP